MERNTFQQALIHKAVRSLNHPTADDIYDFVSCIHPTISKATVYRNLSKMATDKEVLRLSIPNSSDHFDYQIHQHYHFHCGKCHHVFYIDIPYKKELNSFNSAGDFIVTNHTLTFHGICTKCHPSNIKKGIKK